MASQKLPSFNIKFDATASDEEFVDSLDDLFQAADIIEDTLEDGWQVMDLLESVKVQPFATEIVNDLPVFLQTVAALEPQRVELGVLKARERAVKRRGQLGKVTTFIGRFLLTGAGSYQYAISTYKGGEKQYLAWTALLSGAPMFPDELPGESVPA